MKIPESVLNRLLTRSLIDQGFYRSVASEVVIGPGMRVDILAEQMDGNIVLFELKARIIYQRDITQVIRYKRRLEEGGANVFAHLVGDGWSKVERPPDVVLMDWSMFWGQMA